METWLTLGIGGVGVVILAVAGLWVYVSATATPLHPIADDVESVSSNPPAQQWTGAVDRGRQIARAAVAEQNLPGLSIAVGSGGDIVWAEGFGWADVEKKVPVDPRLRFRIGTASTALTSAAVGLLLEKNRLNLDAEIQTYVPEFQKKQWPITVRQVMGHVAGIRNDGGDEGELLGESCGRPAEGLKAFAESELLFEPGTRYRYSSYGWVLMSAAVEAVSGEPFLRFMKTQVFEPLKMNDTVPDSGTEPKATPYFPRFAADPRYGPDVMRDIDLSCYSGASVFLSTPSDLVRFALAINEGKFLQPATVQAFQTSQRLNSGEATGYGLGWDIETVTIAGQQTSVVGHDGDVLGGPVASLVTLRDRGLAVAVISNTSYADPFKIASSIAEAFAAASTPSTQR